MSIQRVKTPIVLLGSAQHDIWRSVGENPFAFYHQLHIKVENFVCYVVNVWNQNLFKGVQAYLLCT